VRIRINYPVRVGELSYINTVPFRLDSRWNITPCPSPRLLTRWAEEGRVDAGVLSAVDGWRLDNEFEPLPYGIAARRHVRSVILFSRRPWSQLSGAVIGLTDQSATSVRLLRLLLETRDGQRPVFREGLAADDEARLLIGDQALTPTPGLVAEFPHQTDLAAEWNRWQGQPFVFARWRVRRTVADFWRRELGEALGSALDHFERNRANVVRQSARSLRLSSVELSAYFDGLTYRLTDEEAAAEERFRSLLRASTSGVAR
jgi:chorismate dehydratase